MLASLFRNILKSTKTITIFLVIVTTILSIIASALVAIDDQNFSTLHGFCLFFMLLSYVGFIGAVMAERNKEQVKLQVKPLERSDFANRVLNPDNAENCFKVEPTRASQFLHIEPRNAKGKDDEPTFPMIDHLAVNRIIAIRVAIVRNTAVNRGFLETLSELPNLFLIDMQGCQVDAEVWEEFSKFNHLKYLAIHGINAPPNDRELHYSIPEITLIREPVVFVHSSLELG